MNDVKNTFKQALSLYSKLNGREVLTAKEAKFLARNFGIDYLENIKPEDAISPKKTHYVVSMDDENFFKLPVTVKRGSDGYYSSWLDQYYDDIVEPIPVTKKRQEIVSYKDIFE